MISDQINHNQPEGRDSIAPVPRLALRPREAAAAIGVSERTLSTWTKEGDVPHFKRNGTVVYPVAQLIAWLAEQACESK